MNKIRKYGLLIICLSLYSDFIYGQVEHKVSFSSELKIEQKKCVDESRYHQLFMDGAEQTGIEGYPSIPVKYIHFLLPPNAKVAGIEIKNSKKRGLDLDYKIIPVQQAIPISIENNNDSIIFINASKYSSLSAYPETLAEIVDDNYFRGVHLITVAVYPCQYYPEKDKLILYDWIDVTLNYSEKTEDSKPVFIPQWTDDFKKTIENIIVNKQDIGKWYNQESITLTNQRNMLSGVSINRGISTNNAKYIIVTSAALAPAFNEFIAWKTRKGIRVKLVTTEEIYANYTGDLISGIYDNAGKVRQFLKDAYLNDCEYALLGGDQIIVPIRYSHFNNNTTNEQYIIPTDLYFSEFDGDWEVDNDGRYGEPADNVDYAQDIAIGRILVNNATEINNWIQKTILYEQNPGNGNFSYLTKAFFTQADELQEENQANHVLNKVTWIPSSNRTIFSEEGGHNTGVTPSFPTGHDVITEFNKNYGLCSFMAHGGPTNVAVATKGHNDNDLNSKHKVISLENGFSGCCIINETGNGFNNMTNIDYPSIFYSISCETMPFDSYGNIPSGNYNMGKTFTCISNGGGPAYLGNTREGWVSYSYLLFGNFIDAIVNGNYNLGKAEVVSKINSGSSSLYKYLKLTHNLIGCPETEIWTGTPSKFTNATVSNAQSSKITVNTGGVSGCTIALTSIGDDGQSYFQVANNVSSYIFTGVYVPVNITITKHNYIPYLETAQGCPNQIVNFINQNVTTNTTVTSCGDINVYNVKVQSGAKLTLRAAGEIIIGSDFEVESGSEFEIIRL